MTHEEKRIKWIENHIDDIDSCNWEKFYMELDDADESSEWGDLYYSVGCITDILLQAGINPLDTTTIIYPNMFVCSQIEHIDISHITMLGRSAFYNSKLNECKIPEGVKDIPMECFESCFRLKWVEIPKSVVRIASDAFPLDNADLILKVHKGSFASKWVKDTVFQWEYIE